MTVRINPYGAFNFLVRLGEAGGENDVAGGFSSAEGFVSEIRFAEYRKW